VLYLYLSYRCYTYISTTAVIPTSQVQVLYLHLNYSCYTYISTTAVIPTSQLHVLYLYLNYSCYTYISTTCVIPISQLHVLYLYLNYSSYTPQNRNTYIHRSYNANSNVTAKLKFKKTRRKGNLAHVRQYSTGVKNCCRNARRKHLLEILGVDMLPKWVLNK
jgi:hypothetical protein